MNPSSPTESELFNALARAAVGALAPSLLMIVMGVLLVGVALGVKRKWKKSFRDPIGTGILRPPGWGCLERKEDALMNLSMMVMVTSLLWAWLGYESFQGGGERALGIAIVILPFTVFAAIRISKHPLGQAKGQAAALRDLLNGEGVGIRFVEPLVALAGWHVSWKKGGTRAICDARNIAGQLRNTSPRLSPLEIERLVHVLDRRCRVLRFSNEVES